MKSLSNFTTRPMPGGVTLRGERVTLSPFDANTNGERLARAISGPANHALWTFMPVPTFENPNDFIPVFDKIVRESGWACYVIEDKKSGTILGTASFMRQRPEHGSCEVGCVAFNSALQKSTLATEAMYLMARHVFDDLDYRRYEWKCHNENAASKRAAARFGFLFEGIFRHDMVMKGKNRDTAWFAMTDEDWPSVKSEFEAWLSPDNFDTDGKQLTSLSTLRAQRQHQQQQ